MNSLFNHKYYYRLYRMNLKSIIGNCKADKFDALNGNGCEYKLNEICAYLRTYGNSNELSDADVKELIGLFRLAVAHFSYKYVEKTDLLPANYDTYTNLIADWKEE